MRLEGLDLARFVAFAGMVLVNFRIVLVSGEHIDPFVSFLEGKAAALFVVLAGVGLGMASVKGKLSVAITLKRAIFLMVLGLFNMLIFPADIIHYYAVYFAIGVWFLHLSPRSFLGLTALVTLIALIGLLGLNYDSGWDWDTYEYQGFWSPAGFTRNLFYNGWHPVFPWIGFLFYGFWLARLDLTANAVKMALGGAITLIAVIIVSGLLVSVLTKIDPEVAVLAGIAPIPPTPLYMAAGISGATSVIGVCILLFQISFFRPILRLFTKAGRISLTLYIAHIIIGMGTFEAMGILGNVTESYSIVASLIFCGISAAFALVWMQFFRAGPLEILMRKLAG